MPRFDDISDYAAYDDYDCDDYDDYDDVPQSKHSKPLAAAKRKPAPKAATAAGKGAVKTKPSKPAAETENNLAQPSTDATVPTSATAAPFTTAKAASIQPPTSPKAERKATQDGAGTAVQHPWRSV
eukprot:jgi/Ulvmu1/2944/UM149_0027.1